MQKSVYEVKIDNDNSTQVITDSICDDFELGFIFIPEGQRVKTKSLNTIKSYIVRNGDFVVEMESRYKTETVPISAKNVEILSACIDSFDDNSVTLVISYPDHETKRLFRKKMRDKLYTMGLLKIGTNFYLDTKENQNGFNIKIVPMSSNYDKVTNDLFDEYIKSQRECNA